MTKTFLATFLTLIMSLSAAQWNVCVAATPKVNRPVKDKWALVVGISKFADPALNLKYPAKDAQDFYNYLIGEACFQPDHVKLLLNEEATRTRVLSVLGGKWLPRAAHPDDLVLIYLSTHGSPASLDVGGVNYLIAYDSDIDNLYATGIPMQDLARMIKGRVHSDRVVVILDACHSGAASPDTKGVYVSGNINAEEVVQGTGQLVISSSEPNQVSWESKEESNSVFTRHLIAGLRSHGQTTKLAEAFNFMKDKVQDEVLRQRGVLQTPVLKSKWEGDELILALSPVSPRPSPKDPTAPTHIANVSSSAIKNIVRTKDNTLPTIKPKDETSQPTQDVFGPISTSNNTSVSQPTVVDIHLSKSMLTENGSLDAAHSQSWWTQFQKKESANQPQIASLNSTTTNGINDTKSSTTQSCPGSSSMEAGCFTVPAWFASQPKPYERPTEVFRSPNLSSLNNTTSGLNAFKATLPLVTAGSVSPFGWGYWGIPYGVGYSGYFTHHPGSLPGMGIGMPYTWGYGWGGPFSWYVNPVAGALWAGSFGHVTGNLGVVTPTHVFQSAPSKPSGNYFAPATADSTASGNYFATTAPAQTPLIAPKRPITNFWGPSGSPFKQGTEASPKSMPWNQ
ncbi:MAG: caspase family protein [Candidatus Melainabacteria bacterium]|nr:caspase family protein [Candidatus Melainabacteria bacterium]